MDPQIENKHKDDQTIVPQTQTESNVLEMHVQEMDARMQTQATRSGNVFGNNNHIQENNPATKKNNVRGMVPQIEEHKMNPQTQQHTKC